MVKTRSTPCSICGQKFRGQRGLRMHERIDHKEVVDFFKEAEISSNKIRSDIFLKKYEKSIISLDDRLKTLIYVTPDRNRHFHKLVLKWEKSTIAKLPAKHPIFKEWRHRKNPWHSVIAVLYEAIGYWACENYDMYITFKEIQLESPIDDIFQKMLTTREIKNLINWYNIRSPLWGHWWCQTTLDRIGTFIRFLAKTSHMKVLIALRLIQGDGEYMLGEPDRCGPVDIRKHLYEYNTQPKK